MSDYTTTSDSCTCPDFIYRRQPSSTFCKHIHSLNGTSLPENHYYQRPQPQRHPNPLFYKFASFASYDVARNHAHQNNMSLQDLCDRLCISNRVIYMKDLKRYIHGSPTYETTYYSCTCPDYIHRRQNHNLICKHIRIFRLGYSGSPPSHLSFQQQPQQQQTQEPPQQPQIQEQAQPHEDKELDTIISGFQKFVKDREQFTNERKAFYKEQEEFQKKFNLCRVCMDSNTIKVSCCNGFLCLDCWFKMEKSRKTDCPFCRTKLKPLVEVLIEKFKSFNC